MGRVSFKSLERRLNLPSLGLIVGLTTLMLFFQNCGKAGMDNMDDSASLLADTPDVKKFKAAPFPFAVNVNQVAYMTCPAVGTGSVAMGEDADAPFFTFRVGAFDNRTLASRYPAFFSSGYGDAEKSFRLNAGVGLSANFMDYIKSTFSSRLAAATAVQSTKIYRDAVNNSTHKYKLSSGLMLVHRNNSGGFAWSQDHAKPMLTEMTSKNAANQLVAKSDLGGFGTEKTAMLTGVDISERSMTTSIRVPTNEAQRDQFRSNIMNYEFAVGYVKPGQENDVFMLAAPAGQDNNNAIYGRTYRFTPTSTWNGRVDRYESGGTIFETSGIQSINSDFISGVQEWETLSQGAGVNISARENQAWDCFSLMIVREVDRRDPLTNKILDPGEYGDPTSARNCSLWANDPNTSAACARKLKFYDYQATATSPIIPAAKVACPIQEIGSTNRYGSLNYTADGAKARLRLEVARRMLPAEHWDVNTHPEYMCAVPKPSAAGFGSCYASGDFNGANYILYSQTAVETVNGVSTSVTCGRNAYTGQLQKECPAFVSLCYRTR